MIGQWAVVTFVLYCWYLSVRYDTWEMDEQEERPLISSGLTPVNRDLMF